MKKIFLLFCCLFQLLVFYVHAIEAEAQDQDVRILKLLPGMLVPLGVAPAIPDQFIAISPEGSAGLYDWIYWGPEAVLNDFFKDESSLSEAIIRVKYAAVTQKEMESMTSDTILKAFQDRKNTSATMTRLYWGQYPVYVVEVSLKDPTERKLLMAWVGLNDPNGWTMKFELLYPTSRELPNDQDLSLWTTFLERTKELSIPQFLKAHGQELHEGYTLVKTCDATMKVTAEFRASDKKLRFVIVTDKNSSFDLEDISVGHMGLNWHYKEPILKLYGTQSHSVNNNSVVIDRVVTVLIKPVREFSQEVKELEKQEGVLVEEETLLQDPFDVETPS